MTTKNEGTQHDGLARDHEHLWLSDLRKNPDGEVRLSSAEGKLISGTYAFQVTRSIDAMVQEAAAPRTITTVEELDALPFESVITDAYNTPYVCEKHRIDGTGNEWQMAGTHYLQESQYVLDHGDVTVRYEPEAEATR